MAAAVVEVVVEVAEEAAAAAGEERTLLPYMNIFQYTIHTFEIKVMETSFQS
jgi:hypothetical protein